MGNKSEVWLVLGPKYIGGSLVPLSQLPADAFRLKLRTDGRGVVSDNGAYEVWAVHDTTGAS
ncbi:hypothetical protein [Microbacterium sp. NPDC057658]|uniref:hypothetical protein n=1 Tax=unclassified Microbacterium TaxID=2609290 RepID=UPI00366D0063